MIDLNSKPFQDELSEFVTFTANLLHESTGPFFRGPKSKGYPVDRQALDENAYYASILFCLAKGIVPRSDNIKPLDETESEEEAYERALKTFELWNQGDLSSAVMAYCQKVNDIVGKRGIAKSETGYCLISDFKARQQAILSALICPIPKNNCKNKFDRFYILQNI